MTSERTLRQVHSDTIRDVPVEVKSCPECGSRFGVDAAFCPFDGLALRADVWDRSGDPLTGKRVDGRYEILEPLGEGGMGTVYRVRHVTLDRQFAMKVLRRDLADDPELARRFVQEAKATAAVKHPGVVAINDFGELEDRMPYYVMELLAGETLATRIRARGPLQPEDAIKVARRIADALEASHVAGVVHRDLKPDNVFLVGKTLGKQAEDDVRIVDFGAARVVGRKTRFTRPGVVFGTPYYMSPEQASGQTVDARADVYSLGVLLYEMVTGTLPFEADTYMGVLTKHMFQKPAKPSERVSSGIPLGALEDVILRALEKDPAARFQTMHDVGVALANARQSSVPRTQRLEPPRFPPIESKTERIQAALEKQLADDARRKRSLLAVATMAGLGTVLTGVAAIWIAQVHGARAQSRIEPAPAVSAIMTASEPSAPAPAPAPAPDPSLTAAPSASAPAPAPAPDPPSPAAPSSSATASTTVRAPATRPLATPRAAKPDGSPPSPTRRAPSDEFPDPWKR